MNLNSAEVFYVSNSGSDSNSGTAEEPWKTIQYAAEEVSAGDTVIVREGTYKEAVTTDEDGAPDEYIVFKAAGRAIVYGFQIKHEYIILDGFELTGWRRNFGIHLTRSSAYCQIKNNFIHYKGEKIGIGIMGKNHLIENNEISGLSCDAMRIFGNGHIIKKNYIHDFKDLGRCHVDVFQSFSENDDDFYDIIFEQNFIKDFEGQMFMIDNSKKKKFENIIVRNNLYVNVKSAGQSYVGPIYIYNNTYVNSGYGNSWVISLRYNPDRGTPGLSVIKNNIFYNCGNPEQNHTGWYRSNKEHKYEADYNLVFPKKKKFNEENGINGKDPLFTSESDYHLQPQSPAIDSGAKINLVKNDKDDNPRQGNFDLGAYEYIPSGD